jgi:hypothetical protein
MNFNPIPNNSPKIILIQQYFIHKDRKRMQELNVCLHWNIANPLIDEIHLLNETIYNVPILKHPKIKQIDIKNRLTFYDAFNYGNNLEPTSIKILSNNDISFHPPSLQILKSMDLSNTCLALNRYDIIKYRPLKTKLYKSLVNNLSGTQDSWIFKKIEPKLLNEAPETISGLVEQSILKLTNTKYILSDEFKFQLGKPGCDNYVAFLIDKLGMRVINNCSTIITLHHHISNKRNYSEKDRVGSYSKYKYLKLE